MNTASIDKHSQSKSFGQDGLQYLDLETLKNTPLSQKPYPYLVLPSFIHPDKIQPLLRVFPDIEEGGSLPLSALKVNTVFQSFVDELFSPMFKEAIENKFEVNLKGAPGMLTLRGCTREKDGKIHRDSQTKIITVLIYFNQEWTAEGGRLRLLNGSDDLEDYCAEVAPLAGTAIIFHSNGNDWHGHKPFEGVRRSIQFNYVTDHAVVQNEQARHARSAKWKRLIRRLGF